MKLFVGWGASAATFCGPDSKSEARVGAPIWGPEDMLRDVELRLGMPRTSLSASVRAAQYSRRIQKLGDKRAFYAKSFEADPFSTAVRLLEWRDGLVDAGWDGEPISDGSERLDALTAIEAVDEVLPLGMVDRVVRAARELQRSRGKLYEEIALVEPKRLWSRRWQRLFGVLEERGTKVFQAHIDLTGDPGRSDLGILQRIIKGDVDVKSLDLPSAIHGDGSVLVLRGETPTELASLTAAILAEEGERAVVIRPLDSAPLETALLHHGLPGQGRSEVSVWRPAMQVLPLAIELAYEPRNPYRALELLTLPVGPFDGVLGYTLARAVAQQPGVGGQEWTRRKGKALALLREGTLRRECDAGKTAEEAQVIADAVVEERARRIEEWLETPGAGSDGAPRERLIKIAERVRAWQRKRLVATNATGSDEPSDVSEVYGAAYAEATAFLDALEHDRRERLTREDARHLLDTVARSPQRRALSSEQAGRVAYVGHPSAIFAPSPTIVFWSFVGGTERAVPTFPWNRIERYALAKAGFELPDTTRFLSVETTAWRRAVLAARERVIFVVPDTIRGEPRASHSLWDEIAARLRLDPTAEARITRHAQAIYRRDQAVPVPTMDLAPLMLPDARATWRVSIEATAELEEDKNTSATALELLASCPFSWVMARHAKVRPGSIAKIASGPLLNGNLSHRLAEELHQERAFEESDEVRFEERALAALDGLIEKEGATLRLFGNSFERVQLKRQILRAMRGLRRYLMSAGFRIAGVEEDIAADTGIGMLIGRLDVRLEDQHGRPAILDLKWGSSTYESRVVEGRAIQLAAYARALRNKSTGEMPPAGYFSVSTARVLTADSRLNAARTLNGPTLEETWRRVERTSAAVAEALAKGEVHVASRRALPLLQRLGVPEDEQDKHFAPLPDEACTYCPYPAICGRQWEELP